MAPRAAAALAVLLLTAQASAREVVLVPAGADGWQYNVLELPALAPDPLERMAILGAGTVASTAGDVAGLGRSPNWVADQNTDWHDSGRAPFAAAAAGVDCLCATQLGGPDTRAAAIKLRRRFEVGDLTGLRALTLRVRYQDGIVVYLNGVQIAQRFLASSGPIDSGAQAAHGPEWESFSIPIVPWLLKPGGNLIAVEVRPNEARDLLFDLALGASDVPRVLVPPYVLALRPDSALIVMETDMPAVVEVRYGDSATLGKLAVARTPSPGRHHEIELTGLGPETHYRASVLAGGSAVWESDAAVLHAPPEPGEPVRFAVYGDTRGGHLVHAEIISLIAEIAPDFVMTTGDLVTRGHDEADWQRLFALISPLTRSIPLYPTIGDHESWSFGLVGIPRFRGLFAQAAASKDPQAVYYSYDVADVHLVFIDSNAYESESQLTWLDADLAAARRKKVRAIFAIAHHGPISRGPHGGHKFALEHYVPVLQKYKVAAFFSGHDHFYERGFTGNLMYVITGGGGADLYRPRCGRPGFKNCRDNAKAQFTEHHFVSVEVGRDDYKLCAIRPDRTELEPCVVTKLPGRGKAPPTRSPQAAR